MPKTLQQVEKSRSSVAGNLTKIVNALTEAGQSLSQRVLEARIKKVEHAKASHDSIIEELQTYDDADADNINNQAEKFEDAYIKALELIGAAEKRLMKDADEERKRKRVEDEEHAQRYKDDAEELAQTKFSMQRDQEKAEAKKHIDDIESQLVAFTLFVDELNPESHSLVSLKQRLNSAEPLLCQFNAASSKAQVKQQERSDFQKRYFHVIDALASAVDTRTPAPTPGNDNNAARPACVTPKLKLPTIELPKFDGTPDTWIVFRDTFKTLIHDSKDLAGAIKFRYLKTSITDKYSPVAHLLESDDGYQAAWEATLARYDDKRKIVDSHFNSIFHMKRMTSESHTEMLRLENEYNIHLSALERIVTKQNLFDAMIANHAIHRLDDHSRDLWETEKSDEIPLWPQLKEFIMKRKRVLSTLPTARTSSNKPAAASNPSTSKSFNSSKPAWGKTSAHVAANCPPPKTFKCTLCHDSHRLSQCSKFIAMTVDQRIAKVREFKSCLNCFGPHASADCRSKYSCRTCSLKHHSMLHKDESQSSASSNNGAIRKASWGESAAGLDAQLNPKANSFQNSKAMCSTAEPMSIKTSLLSTAIVSLKDAYGNWHEARAMLDSGAMSNYITRSVANALRLPLQPTMVEASGFGSHTTMIKHKTDVAFANKDKSSVFSSEFLVTKTITDPIPRCPIDRNCIQLPEVPLADPTYHMPGKIDILLGNDVFWDFIIEGKIRLANGPLLQNTVFGWIIASRLECDRPIAQTICQHNTLSDLTQTMERFYKLEDYRTNTRYLTEEEQFCEKHFEQTHERWPTGRFVIDIPLKENADQLGNNYGNAMSQYLSLEKRLQKNKPLQDATREFFKEYLDLGHMKEVDMSRENTNAKAYYMPHHPVEKPDSTTTKVRVVFNASSKSSSGLSFNDVQCVGPKIQRDSFVIILSFRSHNVVMKADVAKMYRQVYVNPEQCAYQRIIYRMDVDGDIKVYELLTVTYGTASASFQAVRCIKQLAIEFREIFPEAAQAVEDDFFVDDFISGANDTAHAIQKAKEVNHIISSGEMKLRKFNSNDREFLLSIPPEDREDALADDTTIKALGVKWNPSSDTIEFDIKPIDLTKLTKRAILSEIAKIYDPEGLLGPVIFKLKCIMKRIWQLNVSWDEPLPQETIDDWTTIAITIMKLTQIRLPRHAMLSTYVEIQIHAFSDASDLGYGAVIYIRCEDSHGNRASNLMCAKSRIAPNERRSAARLELCGCVININLQIRVVEALPAVPFHKKFCWTDSAISIHWMKKQPSQLQPFVANRVSEIQELSTDVTWRHVRGTDNPADLISRGLFPEELVDNYMWFHGPKFLMESESSWPKSIVEFDVEDPNYKNEFKKIRLTTAVTQTQVEPINRLLAESSRLYPAKRKLAIVLRFIFNARANKLKVPHRKGKISVDELVDAEIVFVRVMQQANFPVEIEALKNDKKVARNSHIKKLHPIWDARLNVIRVGGRLQNANHISDEQKQPILLPKSHLATLIIRRTHEYNMHTGAQATLGNILMRYWIIRAKASINKELHKCVLCFRARPKLAQQLMGQLPASRVTPSSPFLNSGVDYAGPFIIKMSPLRNAKTSKAYIAIFVCMSIKAVHFEVVSELSTKAFLATLDRFTSRRGVCRSISSDNGTQFVGADNSLKELRLFLNNPTTQDAIENHLLQEEIEWKFIPPRAASFGGLWEAGVKTMKYHLHRVIGNSQLTFEELTTVVTKIEAIMNSRPLSAISNDPNDLTPLTPGHFLIGKPLTAKPDRDVSETPMNRLDRWDRITQIQQQFWKRWSRDYLHELQQRNKNYDDKIPVNVGQLVIVHQDNLPPLQWPLGRIVEIHPGKDNLTRVATVKLASTTLKRPLNKLAFLPISDNEQLPPG